MYEYGQDVILRSVATKNLLPSEILRLRLRMTAEHICYLSAVVETRTA